MNPLVNRERIRGAARVIAPGTEPAQVTPEQIQKVAEDTELFLRAQGMTRKEAAGRIGYGASVLSEFLKGHYKGDCGTLAITLDDWLCAEEQRLANVQSTQFVWTNVARQIQSTAAFCLDHVKVGLVYGPETSGIGKSTALRAIHQELGPRRSALVTLDKVDASPRALLSKILGALRLDQSGSNATRLNRIIGALTGRSHLLMIDQVHALRYAKEDRPFYYLMDIYEGSQSAQLWAGTSDLVAYLQRQRAKTTDESLAQIRSRIYPCVDLMAVCGGGADGGGSGGEPLYTVADILSMFGKYRLRLTSAGARWLCALARVPDSGGLRTCVNLMELAVVMASQQSLPVIDVDTLKAALQWGLTAERAQWSLQHTAAMLEHTEMRVA